MEQELPTLPERMSSPLLFSVVCVAQFLSKYAKFSYWHKLIEEKFTVNPGIHVILLIAI